MTTKRETILSGVGVSGGIAIGIAYVVDTAAGVYPEYTVAASKRDAEADRLDKAVQTAMRQLRALKAKTKTAGKSAADDLGQLLDAHIAMLDGSRLVRGARGLIESSGLNAEAAVQHQVADIVRSFEAMEDAYLAARADDVRDAGGRILRNLSERPVDNFAGLPENTIVIAEELTPADTVQMDPKKVAGFAAVLGGAEGHTAIIARSLGVPAVLGAAGLMSGIRSGDTVLLDGRSGKVIVNPGKATLRSYEKKKHDAEREVQKLSRLRSVPAITRDNIAVGLQANLDRPQDVGAALEAGAEGVGLFRTEFLYMNRPEPPSEAEQLEVLLQVVNNMEGRPVTFRTLDIGGEKLAYSLGDHVGGSVNPALGVRGVRLSLKQPSLLEPQFCAMLRAAAYGPVRILLPMITTPGEVRQARDILARMWRRLKRRGVRLPDEMPPLGVMIEVPGAALAADSLAQAADFFAIGTNDLTMYTLAIDRADDQVAHLYNPLHPAVLRLIEFSIQAALRARKPVSICGEMAGNPRFTALLLGLGCRDLSASAPSLLRIKQRIRKLDMVSAASRARMVMEISDAGRIAALLDDMDALV